jgi:hypothetical protein
MAGRHAHTRRGALTACPRCGNAGRSVGGDTVRAMLKPEAAQRLLALKPRFCRSNECNVRLPWSLRATRAWPEGRRAAGARGRGPHRRTVMPWRSSERPCEHGANDGARPAAGWWGPGHATATPASSRVCAAQVRDVGRAAGADVRHRRSRLSRVRRAAAFDRHHHRLQRDRQDSDSSGPAGPTATADAGEAQ